MNASRSRNSLTTAGHRDPALSHRLDAGLSRRLDDAIDDAVVAGRIVGTVVVVLRDGEVVHRRASGFADREASEPMHDRVHFRLASVTKPIVSVAALRLVDLGQLDLDARVATLLPGFRPAMRDGRPAEITVRQLLTHTSGLSYGHFEPDDGPYLVNGVSDGLDRPGFTMDEELAAITRAGLAFEPGTAWGYSVGIDVLGALVARVTERPLPDAVRMLVTSPLGMDDTSFSVPPGATLAAPYADATPPRRMGDPEVIPFMGLSGIRLSPSRIFDPRSFASGGAGMVGTADDVARLLEAVRADGGGLLAPDTSRAMWTNQVGGFPVALGPGWGFGYGGAVLVDPAAASSPQAVGTWSWGGAWGHSWFVDPVARLVVVALTNTAIEGMVGRFPGAIRDAVYSVGT